MSQLQRLLTRRAGEEDLPEFVGADPDPSAELEVDEIAEIDAIEAEPELPLEPRPVMHLTDADFIRAADQLRVEVAALRAVAEIESNGRGFLPDLRPVVLFEAHIFGRLTGHKFMSAKDSLGRALSSPRWDRALYGATGAWQWDGRLLPAAKLDWDAAHKAASWGAFQVLGTNHASVGHPTIKSFVEAMHSGAPAHLDLLVRFIRENKLDGHLRTRNWASFARGYNGPAYAQNNYDTKLAAAYRKWSTEGGSATPTLRLGSSGIAVRRLQSALGVSVDGVFGFNTQTAVREFQTNNDLTVDGIVGPQTWTKLGLS